MEPELPVGLEPVVVVWVVEMEAVRRNIRSSSTNPTIRRVSMELLRTLK